MGTVPKYFFLFEVGWITLINLLKMAQVSIKNLENLTRMRKTKKSEPMRISSKHCLQMHVTIDNHRNEESPYASTY